MLRKDPFVTGEYYHIYNRGIDKRIIFKSKADYDRFVMLLYVSNTTKENIRLDNLINQQGKKFDEILLLDKGTSLVSIGVWCLMPNHFHILIRQEIDGGITKFMRKLGTGYSMYFNIKYKRSGALFGGLFKSVLIDVKDKYMRHLYGYIHLNPLEIRFPNWEQTLDSQIGEKKEFLESYRYSSYLDYIQKNRIEGSILNKTVFPDYFKDELVFSNFMASYLITP